MNKDFIHLFEDKNRIHNRYYMKKKALKKQLLVEFYASNLNTTCFIKLTIIANVVRGPCASQNDVKSILSIWGDALTLNWYLNVTKLRVCVCVCVWQAYRQCNSIEAYPFQLHITSDYAVRDDWLLMSVFSSIRPIYQTVPVAHSLNRLSFTATLCEDKPVW